MAEPTLLLFTLGRNASVGDELQYELSRITPVRTFHLSVDVDWESIRQIGNNNVSICCVYDSAVGGDMSVEKSFAVWCEQLALLFESYSRSNEIIFVFDGGSSPPPVRPSDLGVLPLESPFLHYMRSRPILLRPKLVRYAVAQILDRLVASLPSTEAEQGVTRNSGPPLPTSPSRSSTRHKSSVTQATMDKHELRRFFEEKVTESESQSSRSAPNFVGQ